MGKKKETRLNISVKKTEDFSQWYTEVITKSELIGYYEDVSGCYILRPWCFRIWEEIQSFFDGHIKELGVEPCYFPMFVSKKALETEEDHIDDFAPEVAWVTKSGQSELENPIAIRPTSETIMYPAFAKWIRSHRDLPLKLNQWTNVVRWEFKNPTPFIRTREFLWQEGHTAYASKEEADKEVLDILDLYARVYEELLALPVIKGRKSDKEKFAGGDFTTTVEAYIPVVGRSVQAATSHSLGQNFAKMFGITYLDEDSKEPKKVWQNSWGLTTRSIGILVMTHGDDKGLVLPPRCAPIQLVAVPIYKASTPEEDVKAIAQILSESVKKLKSKAKKVKCHLDDRDDKNPGWKYNYWEQKGVPLRLEIGPADIKEKKCVLVRRDTGEKYSLPVSDLENKVDELLEQIQKDMLAKARRKRDENLAIVWTWDEFIKALGKGCVVLAPWCLTTESEEWVKEETGRVFKDVNKQKDKADKDEETVKGEVKGLTGAAKTLCIPFNQPELPEGTPCFTGNGKIAKEWCLWGRSY